LWKGSSPGLKELDQVGTRNVEQIGSFLTGQLAIDEYDLYRVTNCELSQDIHEPA